MGHFHHFGQFGHSQIAESCEGFWLPKRGRKVLWWLLEGSVLGVLACLDVVSCWSWCCCNLPCSLGSMHIWVGGGWFDYRKQKVGPWLVSVACLGFDFGANSEAQREH